MTLVSRTSWVRVRPGIRYLWCWLVYNHDLRHAKYAYQLQISLHSCRPIQMQMLMFFCRGSVAKCRYLLCRIRWLSITEDILCIQNGYLIGKRKDRINLGMYIYIVLGSIYILKYLFGNISIIALKYINIMDSNYSPFYRIYKPTYLA